MIRFVAVATVLICCSCRQYAPQKNTLTIWHTYNNDETKIFNAIISDYQRVHPALKIIAERVPFDGLLPKLTTAAIAHKTPDIARVDLGHVARLAWGKAIEPLNAYGADPVIAQQLQIARAVATVAVPDTAAQIYALPDQLTTVALYYNKTILARAGIEPPRSWIDLEKTKTIFTRRQIAAKPFAIYASLWWLMPWLYGNDGEILSNDLGRCELAGAKNIATLEYLRSLYTSGVEGGAWISGAINPDQGFLTGRYAMILSGPWNLQTFKSIPFGVALVPGNTRHVSASNIGGSAMVVFRESQVKKEAYDFLAYLVSVDVQLKWARGTGQFSVNKAANRILEKTLSPELKVFLKQLDYAGARPQLPGYDSLESIAAPYLYAALDGSLKANEAMAKACQKIATELLPRPRQ